MMFVQNAGDAGLNQLHRFLVARARRDHQDLTFKPFSPRIRHKVQGFLRSEIDVEQNHCRAAGAQRRQSLGGRTALPYDLEARLLFQHAGESLPEHGVVVNHEEVNHLDRRIIQDESSLKHLRFDYKTGAALLRFVAQFTAIASQHGARDIETQSGAVRSGSGLLHTVLS